MYSLLSDPKHAATVSTDDEDRLSIVHTNHHDESEGSEFLDDALRMKEQPFKNSDADNENSHQ
jgi:hypothetical protein